MTSSEAARRLRDSGPNVIEERRARSLWALFGAQFRSPLVIALILACGLSASLGEWLESTAIAAILVLNAVIGFFQEYRAETAVKALAGLTTPRARVVRSGQLQTVPAREVVPGDLLVLQAGDVVAADARILASSRLLANEALLTGESLPVRKGGENGTVFMGTSIAAGTAEAEVFATGMRAELGKIAHLITTAQAEPTPIQRQLAQLGRVLLGLCLVIVAVVGLIGYLQGRSWPDLILFSLSLAVAAVPEGLPAIVTVALAIGVQRMAARHALVRKLPSVETLGSVSVICTDKTGTLTSGKMRVRELWGKDPSALLHAAAACCDAELGVAGEEGTGDPTELAILLAARERGIERDAIEKTNPRVETEPFDPLLKRMSVHRSDGRIYVKGALEALQAQGNAQAERENAVLAQRGFRVLAVGVRGRGAPFEALELLGLVGIADPPRPEVLAAIAEAKAAGVTPVMITGDHPHTAIAIARELGLVAVGEPTEGRVHARATPADKLRLVREWKARGAIVAMTGDGVNDAPALQEAHVGIAMGKEGTEVTRQAADIILADDNFATIVVAIREGRGIYQNIRKAVLFLIIGNFGEVAAVLGASALGLPLPFLAVHLLWINLVTDALPGLALILEPASSDSMRRPPRRAGAAILGRPEWLRVALVGTLEASVVLGMFWLQLDRLGPVTARGYAFTTLVLCQLFRALGARSPTRNFWRLPVKDNPWVIAVCLLTGLLQLSVHFVPFAREIFDTAPMAWRELLGMVAVAWIPLTAMEAAKLLPKTEQGQN